MTDIQIQENTLDDSDLLEQIAEELFQIRTSNSDIGLTAKSQELASVFLRLLDGMEDEEFGYCVSDNISLITTYLPFIFRSADMVVTEIQAKILDCVYRHDDSAMCVGADDADYSTLAECLVRLSTFRTASDYQALTRGLNCPDTDYRALQLVKSVSLYYLFDNLVSGALPF